MAPDACPKAKNRKRFDPTKSSALAVLMDHEKGTYYPPAHEEIPAPESGPSALAVLTDHNEIPDGSGPSA